MCSYMRLIYSRMCACAHVFVWENVSHTPMAMPEMDLTLKRIDMAPKINYGSYSSPTTNVAHSAGTVENIGYRISNQF